MAGYAHFHPLARTISLGYGDETIEARIGRRADGGSSSMDTADGMRRPGGGSHGQRAPDGRAT